MTQLSGEGQFQSKNSFGGLYATGLFIKTLDYALLLYVEY